ncbi:MYB DNA-binding domain-containing protein [Pestalotiopsis sp. NC0098]|nr:MYB DNA-binding domain-containing protein [Pestalotiopsis sp. NC0098]
MPPSLLSSKQARGGPVRQILSIQSPATVQSGSLWRNPCIGDTLAGNYRVGPDYNVDYSPQDSHPGEQNQNQHSYEAHHHHRGNQLQHPGSGNLHESAQSHQHSAMPQHHTPHHHQILMDPSHLSGLPGARHMSHHGASHYGVQTPSHGVPLYSSMTPNQPHSSGRKRSRPDDLDLSVSGMPELDQGDLDSMQQTPLGAAYAQATSAPPTHHHHHRLPDHGPPTKMMRRDAEGSLSASGGAPSVVGQVGMPAPAARPRGPKLKFTPEDDQLLIDLKENKNLTWKQIADFFPGRSSGTLQVRYCTKLKAKTTQWTDETDQKLRAALADYESEKWRIVANKMGTGFTPVACRERAEQLIEGTDEEENL